MAARTWSESDIPNLSGRRAVVTGANSGIGREVTRMLAAHGASVVMAVRNAERGEAAATTIRSEVPSAALEVSVVDVADAASRRAFAERETAGGRGIDYLINNAGTMHQAAVGPDGIDSKVATNFLGTYALTALQLPSIRSGGRIVTVSSRVAKGGRLSATSTVADLKPSQSYNTMRWYTTSKQAELAFAVELDRRLRATGSDIRSIAVHPGVCQTGLYTQADREAGRPERRSLMWRVAWPTFQSARAGATVIVRAATDPAIEGGQLIGVDGMAQMRGNPTVIPVFPNAADPATATRLWDPGREATGTAFAGL
jgi:NAD(P)-dependent dehydrogenase (short-subunit alcohol dehydrogenase family)